MAFTEQSWKRQEYETWDEAFRGLNPIIRQQSVRVAAYTQALFVQACANSFGTGTADGADRIRGQYAELSYKCGMYHQLGKALVPPEYQLWRDDFTQEEIAVYRKYTSDGRLLVATLQERGARAKEKRKGELLERSTQNIPWLMIRESCQQHMERWDGSGFPEGRVGNDISPIAQIVGLAKELDRLAAETKSEAPFDEAFQALIGQSGKAWNPALIGVLKDARSKCRAVYNKYIDYTRTLPKTIPLVEKRKDRPMGLSYRPMVSDVAGTVVAYEASAWFGGIANRPGETESMDELEEMLCRTELVTDMSMYFLYEAADAVLRMDNCKLEGMQGILLRMLPSFYSQGTLLQRLNQLFQDQPIARNRLMLTIPAKAYVQSTKANQEIVGRYLRSGLVLVLDDYDPELIAPEQVRGLGFTHVRFAAEQNLQQTTASYIKAFLAMGLTVLGKGADDHDSLAWLAACGASMISGTLCGVPVSEDEMIRDCLTREN